MALHHRFEYEPEPAPSVSEAFERVRRTATDLVENRIELLGIEARETGARAGRGAGLLGAAAVLALLSWIGLLAAAGVALARVLEPALAIGVVAVANLLLAVGLAAAGRRALRAPAGD